MTLLARLYHRHLCPRCARGEEPVELLPRGVVHVRREKQLVLDLLAKHRAHAVEQAREATLH